MTRKRAPNRKPDDCRRALEEIAVRLGEANRTRVEAMRDAHDWIPRSVEAGIPITDIAQAVGLSRQTIYTLAQEARLPSS